jgi:DNA repair exonuclease SbcCD ATPase subunit
MKQIDDEDVKFQMRMGKVNDEVEEPEEPVVQTEVHELKLEKINQRVTLISILIPVLIVVVLVITYLDIKKRVVRTEDTGASEFQKLSADLESRFSSLSLRQAKLEEAMTAMTEQNDKNVAAIRTRIDKLQESLKEINKLAAEQKELKASRAEMVKQINTVVESSNAAATQTAAITQELKKQMDQVSQSLNSSTAQIGAVEKKIAGIDQNKIDKATMDLAIKFEVLKVENALKSRIDALQSRINELQNGTGRRSSGAAPSSQSVSSKPSAPAAQAPAPDKPATTSDGDIEEQNLR